MTSTKLQKNLLAALSVSVAAIFLQTLFFKFTGAPETRHIFSTLSEWAADFGLGWVFAPFGPGGPYATGVAELLAAALLLTGTFRSERRTLQVLGAALGVMLMSGALFFHLFTPLGIDVLGDGGLLFALATISWISSMSIVVARRDLWRRGWPARLETAEG